MTKKSTVAIIMERPGVRACGRFLAGVVYTIKGDKELTEDEVTRLVEVKGFTALNAAEVKAIEDAAAKIAAAQNEKTPAADDAAGSDT